jgi:hypothetical protein
MRSTITTTGDKTMDEFVSLTNIGGGVAEEKFQEALRIVLANICDPDTEEKKTREITIKIRIKSVDDSRARCFFSVHVPPPKLAPVKEYVTQIFTGKKPDGEYIAFENSPNQMELGLTADPAAENVIRFGERKVS